MKCSAFEPGRKAGNATPIRSKGRTTYNQTIFQDVAPGEASLSVTCVQLPPSLLGIAFAATPTAVNVTAGTFTATAVAVGKLGTAYRIGHQNLKATPVPVVKSADGMTTYAVGTDYTIDSRLGTITPLASGTMTANSSISVAGSYDIFKGTQFDGETVQTANLQVLFDGKNLVTGEDILVEYYDWQVQAPDKIIDFLSDAPITLILTGTPLTPPGKNAPYTVISGIKYV